MPNWCSNQLTITGPEEDVLAFKEKAAGHSPWPEAPQELNRLNFHSLVPVPEEILGQGYREAGCDWELKNWGCKWGSCNTWIVDEDPGSIIYEFDTAWSPPLQFIATVAKQRPTLTFTLAYDEAGCCLSGIFK